VPIAEATIELSLVRRDDASPEKTQAAESRPRDGPDIFLFLQPASPPAIVQTYSTVQAVPKGSTFEHDQQDGTSEAEIEVQIVTVCCEFCS
jgi:hypothetical protein